MYVIDFEGTPSQTAQLYEFEYCAFSDSPWIPMQRKKIGFQIFPPNPLNFGYETVQFDNTFYICFDYT